MFKFTFLVLTFDAKVVSTCFYQHSPIDNCITRLLLTSSFFCKYASPLPWGHPCTRPHLFLSIKTKTAAPPSLSLFFFLHRRVAFVSRMAPFFLDEPGLVKKQRAEDDMVIRKALFRDKLNTLPKESKSNNTSLASFS